MRILGSSLIAGVLCTLLAFAAQAASFAYIPNTDSESVSVIDLSTNAMIGLPIPVGDVPRGVTVNPAGTRVYVTNEFSNSVSVIDTATNKVLGAPIRVGISPWGIAVNSAGTRAYVANANSYSVSVIDTATNVEVATINIGLPFLVSPTGIVLNPAGTRAYVTSSTTLGGVTVIDTLNNTVLGDPIDTANMPVGIAINPAGTRVYVANEGNGLTSDPGIVSVIDTARNVTIKYIDTGGRASGIAIHPLGNPLYVGGQDIVLVIDTATNIVVGRIPAPSIGRSMGLNLTGTRLLVPTFDGKVLVIDTATNAIIATVPVPGHHDFVGQFFVADIPGPGGTPMVVEFYHAGLDHYFITWMPSEIAKLDAGTEMRGWARTGHSFKTYTTSQAGTSPVCRYYIPPGLGDSHFFGRGTVECDATGQKNPRFMLEDPAFMQMYLPAAGMCPADTTPIYRVFSNRLDANHRYMTDRAVRDQMVTKGWLAEGDGPDLIVMCAPE